MRTYEILDRIVNLDNRLRSTYDLYQDLKTDQIPKLASAMEQLAQRVDKLENEELRIRQEGESVNNQIIDRLTDRVRELEKAQIDMEERLGPLEALHDDGHGSTPFDEEDEYPFDGGTCDSTLTNRLVALSNRYDRLFEHATELYEATHAALGEITNRGENRIENRLRCAVTDMGNLLND